MEIKRLFDEHGYIRVIAAWAVLSTIFTLTGAFFMQGIIYKQGQVFTYGTGAPPLPCLSGDIFIRSGALSGVNLCEANVWNQLPPSGGIIFIDSGVCPPRYTEVTALNGHAILGTVAANGNVGTLTNGPNLLPAGVQALRLIGCKRN